jgi:hypothetical protein
MSYEYANRDGDQDNFNPYGEFFTSSLPGYIPGGANGFLPHTLADLRKFDLSDRKQHLFNARMKFQIRSDMDLFLSAQWQDNDYQSDFGLNDDSSAQLNAEWSYRLSARGSAYAYYSYQRNKRAMANINDFGFGADANAGGPVFPDSASWRESSDGRHHSGGLGIQYGFDRFTLSSDYSISHSIDEIDYDFAPADALGLLRAAAPAAGNSFPDIRYTEHVVTANIKWHISERTNVRLYHRFEKGSSRDWHHDGLTPLVGRNLFLAAAQQSYDAHLFGIFINHQLR